MIKRSYYSARTGKLGQDSKIDFKVMKQLFLMSYKILDSGGYFQKYFGLDCVDGYAEGQLGNQIQEYIFINLRKNGLYPIYANLDSYSEDDFFDMIEFLHDHCSKGVNGYYHNYYNCGYHYDEFNDLEGQKYFRELMNPILRDYESGFEISEQGEVLILSDNGLSNLFDADIPTFEKENISDKINFAISKFRRHKATLEDRKEAVRVLADVLEFLRPDIKKCLNKKDENDIFNIANNFGIRHHNAEQKTDYNKPIWYSWMFYYYLATLHAVLRMIKN